MRFLRTVQLVAMSLAALAAGAACSSHVSEGGSETNWLCGVDTDCGSGQVCVRKKCQAASDASTGGRGPDAGVGGSAGGTGSGGAGGNDSLQGRSTTQFTDVIASQAPIGMGNVEAGRCLPITLERDTSGRYPCSVIDVAERGRVCDATVGLVQPSPRVLGPARNMLQERGVCDVAGAPSCDSLSLCELGEATGAALQYCLNGANLPVDSIAGWCYVDPANGAGRSALVDRCQPGEHQMLRFTPLSGDHTLVIACFGSRTTPASPAAG